VEENLKIAERVHALTLRELEPGWLRLEMDGTAADVRVVASSGGRHLVEIGGTLETIFTAPSPEGTWVWHRGRARLVTRQPSGVRPQASAEASNAVDPGGRSGSAAEAPSAARRASLPPGSITPPMPAAVVAVLVEEGRLVERGEPLVVLSAMKTETQLIAPVAGRVTAVSTQAGAKVRPGEVLVRLEPVQVEGDGERHGG
jgi:biotin carboxyl carrier protein